MDELPAARKGRDKTSTAFSPMRAPYGNLRKSLGFHRARACVHTAPKLALRNGGLHEVEGAGGRPTLVKVGGGTPLSPPYLLGDLGCVCAGAAFIDFMEFCEIYESMKFREFIEFHRIP